MVAVAVVVVAEMTTMRMMVAMVAIVVMPGTRRGPQSSRYVSRNKEEHQRNVSVHKSKKTTHKK